MPQTNETPAGKAGARSDLLGGGSQGKSNSAAPLAQSPPHRQAALELLVGGIGLTCPSAQFLGQIAVSPKPLSERQQAWLNRLLAKHLRRSLTGEVLE
jgi:hypothetical protein